MFLTLYYCIVWA